MIIDTDLPANDSHGPVAGLSPLRPTGHRPVFILATPRSYSTVTVAMLAGHPQVFGFPELALFSAPTVGSLLAPPLPDGNTEVSQQLLDSRLTGVLRAIAHLHFDSQDAAAIGRARKWLESRPGWSTTQLMDHLLTCIKPCVGLEKSPETVGSVKALQRCISAYPDARFIHLTRHPIPAQRSMHELWSPAWGGHSAFSLTVAAASSWYRGNLRAAQALAGIPAERWMRIHAEDLMSDPAKLLPEILGWLGLKSSDQTIERMLHTELWPFASRGPAQALFGGDPKFLRNPRLRPVAEHGIDGRDPAHRLPGSMRHKMADLAGHLGY